MAKKKHKVSKFKSGIEDVSLYEHMSMISKYKRKHKTSYTYGQFVSFVSIGRIKI